MNWKPFALSLALLITGPGWCEPVNGDLCFPMEGWAIVARWNLGTGARSMREGWLRKEYNDGGWDRQKAGDVLPASEDGTWLRNAFRGRGKSCPDARAVFSGISADTIVFLNGIVVEGVANGAEVPISFQYRKGTNILIIFCPRHAPGEEVVPSVTLLGLSGSGKSHKPNNLKTWRVRAEKTEKTIPDSWLRKPGSLGWKIRTTSVPASCRGWLPPGPVCLKTGIDVPYYWRGRTVSLFLHEMPGTPSVYLNGRLLVEKLGVAGRFDLTKTLNFDGRDTLCIVYPDTPPCDPGRDGRWGMAALRWEGGVRLPKFPSGSTVFFDFSAGADQEGTRQAIRYASQLISLSSTSYTIEWSSDAAIARSAGIVASWSASRYSSSDISRAESALMARVGGLRKGTQESWWVVTPSTVGKRYRLPANERLSEANRKFIPKADEAGLKVIPLFDVMRSALRRQRRWPAQAEWSSDTGEMTAHGSYLMALAMLDTFSMQ